MYYKYLGITLAANSSLTFFYSSPYNMKEGNILLNNSSIIPDNYSAYNNSTGSVGNKPDLEAANLNIALD